METFSLIHPPSLAPRLSSLELWQGILISKAEKKCQPSSPPSLPPSLPLLLRGGGGTEPVSLSWTVQDEAWRVQ